LFFCAMIDAVTAGLIAGFTRRLLRETGLTGSEIGVDRFHISLHHVGDFRRVPPFTAYLCDRVAPAFSMPAFEIEFTILGTFPLAPPRGGKPAKYALVLGCDDAKLHELHAKLGAELEKYGLKVASTFKPHITLLYCSVPVAFREIEPIRVVVREVFLIHSRRGLTQYVTLGKWPLDGRGTTVTSGATMY
jgi:RNA 2',3'-cyclic 3'-phosphodiesterase